MPGLTSRRLAAFLLGAGLCGVTVASACAEKKGALMLAINTDMKAPKDVNAVSVTISTNGAIKHSFIGRVTPQGEVVLPATLAIAEPDDKSASIRVRVMAFQDRKPRVLRDVRTTVPSDGRVALLRIPLNFVSDRSAVGAELPPGVLPDSAIPTGGGSSGTGGPSGPSGATSAADFDFFGSYQPPCPDIQNQTIIDGECKDNFVDPETLPDFDSSAIAESTSAGACFDVTKCFPGGAVLQNERLEDCAVAVDGDPARVNLALVTKDTGECLRAGDCFIPLDRGPDGFEVGGGRARLAAPLCKLVTGNAVRLARSVGACPSKVPTAAICAAKVDDANVATTCGAGNAEAVGATKASKVDVLFVVDNSASMADKAKLLSASAATFLQKVATTNDVHVGVISTSLGAFGGDVCASTGRQNDKAHLLSQRADGTLVQSAQNGVLAFGAAAGGGTDLQAFTADVAAVIEGVGETGCGLEAQLESAYHFLAAPDPWQAVRVDAFNQADLGGASDIDVDLLVQRAAFLRPDSLLVVVMLTDEDDSSVDPLAIGGQGWAFMNNQFPGSTTFRADGKTTTAPRATLKCDTDPGSPDCTSCGFAATCNPSDAACLKVKNDPECVKNNGYYGASEEQLNVRFHRMKERFGIDPQYPLSRYVGALTNEKVPNRSGEHATKTRADGKGRDVGTYCDQAACTNPVFAAKLPSQPGEELCNVPRGPRGKELVIFALIGGVSQPLVQDAVPQWNAILGRDIDKFDYTGIDPHMIQSPSPRAGLSPPSVTRGDNGPDPIHGREWDTAGNDLQYACTFALAAPRICMANEPRCDCAGAPNPPLCGAPVGQQTRAKGYPTVRELRLARALGDRALVASVCDAQGDAGYTSFMTTLGDRAAAKLSAK